MWKKIEQDVHVHIQDALDMRIAVTVYTIIGSLRNFQDVYSQLMRRRHTTGLSNIS